VVSIAKVINCLWCRSSLLVASEPALGVNGMECTIRTRVPCAPIPQPAPAAAARKDRRRIWNHNWSPSFRPRGGLLLPLSIRTFGSRFLPLSAAESTPVGTPWLVDEFWSPVACCCASQAAVTCGSTYSAARCEQRRNRWRRCSSARVTDVSDVLENRTEFWSPVSCCRFSQAAVTCGSYSAARREQRRNRWGRCSSAHATNVSDVMKNRTEIWSPVCCCYSSQAVVSCGSSYSAARCKQRRNRWRRCSSEHATDMSDATVASDVTETRTGDGISKNVLNLIGNTPMVYLNKVTSDCFAKIACKLEALGPCRSVKDRIALAMVEDAERRGLVKPGVSTFVEATSGNTGVGLAFVCASKGYKLILTMPEDQSIERRILVQAFGAQVVLTPAKYAMTGAIKKAEELCRQIPNSHSLQQFNNPANPRVHFETTGPEIWRDTCGKVDY